MESMSLITAIKEWNDENGEVVYAKMLFHCFDERSVSEKLRRT